MTSESPIAEPGKIDLGRTIGETEIQNLPLVSRNPYNFAFLQANVTGYENNEFGVPRINANGTQMHTNYQIDGNTNTEKDRAGLRMLPISEVLVREVKVITNGFAPEFGQTTGMVYNAITQSGHQQRRGSASYRFKRNAMSSRPFFLAPTARKPDTEANDVTATLGGPIQKDKWHYFGAYEYVDRSLITGGQVITVTPADAAGARHHAPRERRHPGASEGQFRVRQDRLSALAGQPPVGSVLRLQEFLGVQHRRRTRRPPTGRPISPIAWTRPRRSWSPRSAAAC